MKKFILGYGLCGGLLILTLQLVEYRFLVLEHSIEIYGGLIALVFAAAGIGLGVTLTRTKPALIPQAIPEPTNRAFALNDAKLAELGITRRELEILQHIAAGMSTREIAEALFVSENTVKTHASRLFDKLNVRRRTQAVHVAKQLGLIP